VNAATKKYINKLVTCLAEDLLPVSCHQLSEYEIEICLPPVFVHLDGQIR